MGKLNSKLVAAQEVSSEYEEHLYVFRIVSGVKLG